MTIVYVDIVGDLYHYGHVRMFKSALKYGDYLYVGVMGDKDCEQYKRRPIMRLEERCEVIQSCKYVTKIIPNAPMPITKEFMEKHSIDIVCHSDDMNLHDLNYWYSEAIKKNKFKLTKYTKSISTSEIIKRCKEV